MGLSSFLDHRDRMFHWLVSIVLVLIVGVIDALTGFNYNISLFYLAPIALGAWYLGRRPGLILSGLSAITWFLADVISGHQHSLPDVLWNTLMPLVFFLIVTLLITALKEALRSNREMASEDFITGAASLRHFYEIAQAELERARRYNHPFSLAFIDLDNFKQVNDRFGHSTGDRVLKTVSDVIRIHIRPVDTLARVGGDEFCLLLPETDEKGAPQALERILGYLAEEMQKNRWGVTFSIGVVICKAAPGSVDELVKMADDVMYSIKLNGKDGVGYTAYEGEVKA